jgi:glycerol-3-phosphate acyltransferase PlsX
MNGIRVASEFAQAGVNDRLEREFASRPTDPPTPDLQLPIQ